MAKGYQCSSYTNSALDVARLRVTSHLHTEEQNVPEIIPKRTSSNNPTGHHDPSVRRAYSVSPPEYIITLLTTM